MSKEPGSGIPKQPTISKQDAELVILNALPSSVFYNHALDIAGAILPPEQNWGIGCSDNDILYCKLFQEGQSPQDIHRTVLPTSPHQVNELTHYYHQAMTYFSEVFSPANALNLPHYLIEPQGDDILAKPARIFEGLNSKELPMTDLGSYAVGTPNDLKGATKFFETLPRLRAPYERYLKAVANLRKSI